MTGPKLLLAKGLPTGRVRFFTARPRTPNREIGEQLFVSHRTAGYHLGKVVAKLDVANRAQVRSALDSARS